MISKTLPIREGIKFKALACWGNLKPITSLINPFKNSLKSWHLNLKTWHSRSRCIITTGCFHETSLFLGCILRLQSFLETVISINSYFSWVNRISECFTRMASCSEAVINMTLVFPWLVHRFMRCFSMMLNFPSSCWTDPSCFLVLAIAWLSPGCYRRLLMDHRPTFARPLFSS